MSTKSATGGLRLVAGAVAGAGAMVATGERRSFVVEGVEIEGV
ncbi:hypothetical protein N1031_18610 [Herbiconiux moechotypicola]|nr:hypothetical protein [Herbiconiux moechotypicola]MCS5731771.1 hypothetical protein [Herbiconiux moechotypicola]